MFRYHNAMFSLAGRMSWQRVHRFFRSTRMGPKLRAKQPGFHVFSNGLSHVFPR